MDYGQMKIDWGILDELKKTNKQEKLHTLYHILRCKDYGKSEFYEPYVIILGNISSK